MLSKIASQSGHLYFVMVVTLPCSSFSSFIIVIPARENSRSLIALLLSMLYNSADSANNLSNAICLTITLIGGLNPFSLKKFISDINASVKTLLELISSDILKIFLLSTLMLYSKRYFYSSAVLSNLTGIWIHFCGHIH